MSQPVSDKVLIFDTTLRDGEQCPGASMNLAEKLEIAYALKTLGVDIIEAGYPAASPGDFDAVVSVARHVEGPVICGLARCLRPDIDRAWEAVRDAAKRRIHVFLATSAIHREHKLQMAKEEIIKAIRENVRYARDYTEDIEFSPEDASRTELDFLAEVVERAIECGATTINVPDTVGYTLPSAFAETFAHLKKTVRGIDRVKLSVHCHNDLGLAVANSLAAVAAGARQVECTVNGLGERAGNCAMEEIVMALKTRRDFFKLDTNIDTKRLYPTSRLVSNITGMRVQRNKAIVGQNAFAHEAGIHQHGMLMHRETYEIMQPEEVGYTQSDLILGKHSGRHAVRHRIKELGYHLDEVQLNRVFEEFKALADKKKELYDADIEALVRGEMWSAPASTWDLIEFHTSAGTGDLPTAAVLLKHVDGHQAKFAVCGDGPVDAVFKAVSHVTGISPAVRDYQVRSVSTGEDAQGEAILEVEFDGRIYRGRAVSTDVIEASTRAYLSLVNRILRERQIHPESSAIMAAAAKA
jgi:2-isopropylmalate synthase